VHGSVNGPRRFAFEDRFKPSGARPSALEARAEFKHAQEIEETFHKDFDGGGLS
jgi:hypothetical protein